MKIITKNKSLFFILIFTLSNLTGTEIWEKEIPPSRYLENFAKNSEEENEKGLKNISYALLIMGTAAITAKSPTNETKIVAPICLLGGAMGLLIHKIRKIKAFDKPRTPSGKEYKKIKNSEDENKKEFLAYQSLVKLANDSKKSQEQKEPQNRKKRYNNASRDEHTKNIISNFISGILKDKLRKEEKLKTKEEKVLDDYLNQKPIK